MDTQLQKKYKVLLIGDSCKDIYQFGKVNRISPEAPVPVFTPTRSQEMGGMADNVKSNLEKLGLDVSYLKGQTSVKTRLVDERSGQQIARIDEDAESQPLKDIPLNDDDWDAVVVSDYDKGTIDYELVNRLNDLSIPVFVDTKKTDLRRFSGCILKINELEYGRRTSDSDTIVITMAGNGARILSGDTDITTGGIPSEVVDVTGAGDTFLAALTFSYIRTRDLVDAVEFANRAASRTVQHLGVYAPSIEEIV